MREPQEIHDEEYEQVAERVAAVDVATASGMVCTRVPHPSQPGRRLTKVWEVEATTGAIIELGGHLAGLGVEKVTVESTSDYWRAFLYLLEAAGLEVQLVNARDVKNVPGRPKTDRLDAVWLAKLTERGMLRPSFVPPVEIRQLRDYTRLRLGPDPGPVPARPAAGEAAGRRPDQALHRGHRHHGQIRPGDDRGADLRSA
jgi:transposase